MTRWHQARHRCSVSIIIPAYDEEATIADVVAAARASTIADEVLVVDDGSSDATPHAARRAGAHVITLPANCGKGEAMAEGVRQAGGDVLAFFDADILGLQPATIDAVIEPVVAHGYDMFTVIRDRFPEPLQYFANLLLIGGERAVTRAFWDAVPAEDRRDFSVEIALNFYAQQRGMRTGTLLVPGLRHIMKERKHGLVRGIRERLGMMATCTGTLLKLHARHTFTKSKSS